MKKIGVMTFCEWNSYGSMLQAYGLKEVLNTLGYHETIYKTFRMPRIKKIKNKSLKNIIKYLVSLIHIRSINRAYKNNTEFIESNFDIVYYNGYAELKSLIEENDFFMVGSDQVWHPVSILKEMFLDFNTYGKKRLSYAASFGVSELGDENKSYIREKLLSFDAISVREKSMVPIIKSLSPQLSADVHIDPTFLLDKKEWKKLLSKKKGLPDKYILVYAIYWNRELNEELIELSKSTNLPVVSIEFSRRPIYSDKRINDCDIKEFLWLINNAEYVVTSSFHGLAFSIIFNKKFSAVINPELPARLTDLLELFSIKNCSIANIESQFSVDYSLVDQIILEEKEKSIEYLRSILK